MSGESLGLTNRCAELNRSSLAAAALPARGLAFLDRNGGAMRRKLAVVVAGLLVAGGVGVVAIVSSASANAGRP